MTLADSFAKSMKTLLGFCALRVCTVCLVFTVPAWCVTATRAAELTNTEIQFDFGTLGTVDVDLFNNVSQATVNNFLSYVNSAVLNGTLVHRAAQHDPNPQMAIGIIQGGGFTYSSQNGGQLVPISAPNTVNLDYTLPNAIGTIAMARTNDPNSASSQWFINVLDNSSILNQANGGGYAVFGCVVGSGMSVVHTISNLTTTTVGGFPDVPLINGSNPVSTSNLVVTNSVSVLSASHAAFQNPAQSLDVNHDGTVTSQDATTVIQNLVANGSHAVGSVDVGTNYSYVDVNGSGLVSPIDALLVINFLLASATPSAIDGAVTLNTTSMSNVPEPSSLALAALGFAALATWRWRRP
jgi:peptidyl-prolyl cis-trans isomerase A (cyclophilin A)